MARINSCECVPCASFANDSNVIDIMCQAVLVALALATHYERILSIPSTGHRIPPEKKTPLFSVNVWLWEWMAKNVYGLINFHAKSDSSVIIAIFIEREERVHNEPSSKVNVWRMKIAPDRRGAARREKKRSLLAKIDDKTTQYSNRFL